MASDSIETKHYLHAGTLYVHTEPRLITTVLGSCISVCLWDTHHRFGGMNHYQLALWNGNGLASPKYGNVAIHQLVKRMLSMGSHREHLISKVFGGGAVMSNIDEPRFHVGKQNIEIAWQILEEERIPILTSDVGGQVGRKLIFDTSTGQVKVKRFSSGI
jgi:chemotaxis protein CheD